MSGSQKALKVISILVIILAVISIIFGLVFVAYVASGDSTVSQSMGVQGVDMTNGQGAALLAGITIVSGFIDLIVGIFGVRGANNPQKIGAFWVIALIGVIFEVVELVLTIVSMVQGTADWSMLSSSALSLAIVGVAFWLANNIKKDRQ